jgi:hypothetical protein
MIVPATLLAQAQQYALPVSAHRLIFVQWILPIPIAAFCAILIVCILRAARYLGSATKEQKLLRMEISKSAEELYLLRQELNHGKGCGSPVQ